MLLAWRSEYNSPRLTRAPDFNAARSLSRNSFLVRSHSPDLATVISLSLPLAFFLFYINAVLHNKFNAVLNPLQPIRVTITLNLFVYSSWEQKSPVSRWPYSRCTFAAVH